MQIVTKNGFVLDCWCNLDSSAWLQPATLDVPEGAVLGEGWKKRIHGGGMIENMSILHIVCLYSWLVKVSRYVLVLLLSNSPLDRLIKIFSVSVTDPEKGGSSRQFIKVQAAAA